jgi:hypothetical protein
VLQQLHRPVPQCRRSEQPSNPHHGSEQQQGQQEQQRKQQQGVWAAAGTAEAVLGQAGSRMQQGAVDVVRTLQRLCQV